MNEMNMPDWYREIKQPNDDCQHIRIWESRMPNEDIRWDSFIANVAGGRYEQTSLWAQVKKVDGWQPLRIIFTVNNEIVAGFQILIKKKPIVGFIGYVSKGPVVKGEDLKMIGLVISQLKQITKKFRIKVLIVQPPDYSQSIFGYLGKSGFLMDNITKAVSATARVDLKYDLDTIFGSMNVSTKRNIKIGIRKGIKVREGNEGDIRTFFKFMLESCKRQNVSPSPANVDFFTTLWRKFNPNGYVKLLISEYDCEDVSSIFAIPFGETVYIYKIGWSGRFGSYRPNDVTHWELIKSARANDYRYLDFVGIEPEAADAICQGKSLPDQFKQSVSSFKLGFGGEALLLSKSSVYIYNPFLKFAYEKIFPRIKSLPVIQNLIHSV